MQDAKKGNLDDLPGHFLVWLASPEASFLNGKFVWANWDVEELKERAWETKLSQNLQLTIAGLTPPGFSLRLLGSDGVMSLLNAMCWVGDVFLMNSFINHYHILEGCA